MSRNQVRGRPGLHRILPELAPGIPVLEEREVARPHGDVTARARVRLLELAAEFDELPVPRQRVGVVPGTFMRASALNMCRDSCWLIVGCRMRESVASAACPSCFASFVRPISRSRLASWV